MLRRIYDPGLGRPPRVEPIQCRAAAGSDPWNDGRGGLCGLIAARGFGLALSAERSYSGDPGRAWPEPLQSSDLTLLNSQIGSATVKAAGYSLPFASFPPTATLTNASASVPAVWRHYAYLLRWQLLVRLAADEAERETEIERYGARHIHVGQVDYAHGYFQRLDGNLNTQKALDVNSIPQALSVNLIYQTPHLRFRLLG